ncbi:CAP domain-containing protein [Pleurocapsales cyanobacterium LEGE 10410]|nr:CAP domain-containing protein [Pleurocapsales cyanobacterium LEGE 10410]
MNSDFTNQVVTLINVERTEADLDPLQIDSQLSQAARVHSESMAERDFFSHSGVDDSSPFDRIQDTGYQYSTAAENIAAGYQTPETVVEAWMGSAGHRANILNSDFTEIGVGYEYLANDTGSVNYNSYWTTTFGTPM